MTAPSADQAAKEASERLAGEQDLWWGSYAGRAMMPSFAVCIVLTVLIYLGARWWVPERGWLQLTFTGLTSAVWLVQLARWGHRFFTWNYRLTSRYLYLDRGLKSLVTRRIALWTVDEVAVRCNWLEKCLGIGDLWVSFKDKAQTPVVMKALVAPRTAATTIREAAKTAHETIK